MFGDLGSDAEDPTGDASSGKMNLYGNAWNNRICELWNDCIVQRAIKVWDINIHAHAGNSLRGGDLL